MAKSKHRVYPLNDYILGGVNITETTPGGLLFTFDEYQHEKDVVTNIQMDKETFLFKHMLKYMTIPDGTERQQNMIKGWLNIASRNPSKFVVKIIKIVDALYGNLYFIHAGKTEIGGYQRTFFASNGDNFIGMVQKMLPQENIIFTTVDLTNTTEDKDTSLTSQKVYGTFDGFIGSGKSDSLAISKDGFDTVSQEPISEECRVALQEARERHNELTENPEKIKLLVTDADDPLTQTTTPIQTAATIAEKSLRRIANVLNETADEIRTKFKL